MPAARFAGRRNRIGLPRRLAGLGIKSLHEAAYAELAAGYAFEEKVGNSVVYHEGPNSFDDNIETLDRFDGVFRSLQTGATSLPVTRSYLLDALS